MMRKIGLTLLLVLGVFSNNATATQLYTLAPSMSVDYEFPPQDPKVLKNPFFWAVNANCTLESENTESLIRVFMEKRTAKVNKIALGEKDIVEVVVRSGDVLAIYAASGAEVEITNLANNPIKAKCSS